MASQLDHVRDFFEADSSRYAALRYPSLVATCEQLSYLTRRSYVLSMLDASCPRPGAILDIGCGPGVYTDALVSRGWNVCGLDLAPGMLVEARRRVETGARAHFAVGQALNLPFRSSTFQAVLCIGVVSYVDDLRRGLAEVSRVLVPGGFAIFQISNKLSLADIDGRVRSFLGPRLRGPARRDAEDHIRMNVHLSPYRPRTFRRLCEDAGLMPGDWRYYDFRTPILVHAAPRIALSVGQRLERFGRSRLLGWLGAGYLTSTQKR